MKKMAFKKLIMLLLCTAFITSLFMVPVQTEAAEYGYTYAYDFWGDWQLSPDAYETVGVYTAVELGLDKRLMSPQGVTVHDDKIYVCDTGNNRIIEIGRNSLSEFEVLRVIDSFTGEIENTTFNGPTDVGFDAEGNFYICDNVNQRVLKLTPDLEYVMELTKPDDANIAQDADFLPRKIAIDNVGRIYLVATNINQGLVKYEADGTFTGFIGASNVVYSMYDYIWKRLSTQEQRDMRADFVPTEYTNVYMDHEGFLFTCTVNVKEEDVRSGSADVIRRLNLLGSDILIRNGEYKVMGDLWTKGGESGYTGISLINDITCLENSIYMALDRTRNRIFAYDDQGKLMFAFGGPGNEDGYFRGPISIDHLGNDLVILDSVDASITILTPTEYGSQIFEAITQFQNGNYDESRQAWEKVMSLNGNYDAAYIGIGRALMRDKKYKEAMEYFELKWDDENYSKAFKQYRKVWVKENIFWILLGLAIVIFVPLIGGRIKKIKREIDTADIFKYKKYDI